MGRVCWPRTQGVGSRIQGLGLRVRILGSRAQGVGSFFCLRVRV